MCCKAFATVGAERESLFGCRWDRDDRLALKVLVNSQTDAAGRPSSSIFRRSFSIRVSISSMYPAAAGRFLLRLLGKIRAKFHPLGANTVKQFIVFLPVRLEIRG